VTPTFIGLGGQKCASTWLHAVLRDHPDAFVCVPKELDFFSSFYDRGFQWYEAHFAGASGRRAIGEISPSYLPDHDAPARAQAYNPNFRIVVALRDPVERAYSNHLHEVRLGHYSSTDLSFEAGLANNPTYVEQSRFAIHLARWLEYFPLSQMLVLFQEEIQSNPSREARRLYTHLGIDPEFVSPSAEGRSNETYLARSRGEEELVRGVGKAVRKYGFGWLDRLLRRAGVISALHRRNRLDIRTVVPPMTSETRERLQLTFGPETIQLAAMFGRDSLPWETWRRATGGQSGIRIGEAR
jgi:hypothetical protein